MTKENKCESYLDHNPVWGGDGYFCSECMIRFVPKESYRQEIIEKIEKLPFLKEKNNPTALFGLGDINKIINLIKEDE